ncbi:hypothetical protein PVK06_003368 [Gossypium arboreum]|uniref:Uncharacterized protein n=1 Tax=Gossypium arboreum TaxID=29729 RepID=A0ABR0R6B3_GOSAR|nr:hypothetical protein PVK06_003368 [Gossypium arboreum]
MSGYPIPVSTRKHWRRKINTGKGEKNDGPGVVSSLSHGGSEWIKPVILPLPGAGGVRCSVKPASRFFPLFKNHETQAYARAPWSNSWLGTGKPMSNH